MSTIKFRLALMSAATTFVLAACSGEADRDDTPEPANNNAAAQAANDSGPDPVAAAEEEAARINAWFEETFEAGVARSPIAQTFLGRKTNYGEWDDASPEFAEESHRLSQADYSYMRDTFDRDALPEAAQLSYDLFEYNNARESEGWQWRDHGYTFTPALRART